MGWMGDSVLETLWIRIRTYDLQCYRVLVGICYKALIRVRKCRNSSLNNLRKFMNC